MCENSLADFCPSVLLNPFVLILLSRLKYAPISCHKPIHKNNVWLSELTSY